MSIGCYSFSDGTIRFRPSIGRNFIKIDGKWLTYAPYLWEQTYGKIAEGYVIHHIDFDKSSDTIDNLVCLTVSEHNALHSALRTYERDTEWRENHSKKMRERWDKKGRHQGSYYTKKHPNGYVVTEETKRRIRETLHKTLTAKPRTEEQRKKHSEAVKAAWQRRRQE